MSRRTSRRVVVPLLGLAAAVLVAAPFLAHLAKPAVGGTIVLHNPQGGESTEDASRWIDWILRHEKFPSPTGSLSEFEGVPDILYLSGLSTAPAERDVALNRAELERVHDMVMEGADLVAEVGSLQTPMDHYVRADLERLLGIRATGWTGKRIEDLSAPGSVPDRLLLAWEEQSGEDWSFEGGGTVFANRDGRAFVLPDAGNVETAGVQLHWVDELRAPGRRPRFFAGWFMVTQPLPEAETLAEFALDVNATGAQLLEDAGIPATFPALTAVDSPERTVRLFTGDFSQLEAIPGPARYSGYAAFRARFTIAAPNAHDHAFWSFYVPALREILAGSLSGASHTAAATSPTIEWHQDRGTQNADSGFHRARIRDNSFEVFHGGGWKPLFVKGVNLGAAFPGRMFTDFVHSDLLFMEWFAQTRAMHINTIRVYTLQAPAFYRALANFNELHPDEPLWLLHEIWPEEHPPNDDLLDENYRQAFEQEIAYVVDAVNGDADVPPRVGRADGTYRHDVSAWVLGYLVGREIEPKEVVATDERHEGYTYDGAFISSSGTPSEAWLAWACDVVARYEYDRYGRSHPLSIVSWPPLDPLHHPSEWELAAPSEPYNDKAQVDANHIDVSNSFAPGFFGSYHIYPNYPDFIINEAEFARYRDDVGELRFGGYLTRFLDHHTRYPVLIAEFGMATGHGIAHYSPDGLHHGGVSEIEQADGIIRMFEVMRREGTLGGVIFEWIDEWVKKTWVTEPLMVPFEHNAFWRNALDPEQNYGIIAYDAVPGEYLPVPGVFDGGGDDSGEAIRVATAFDAAYLHLRVDLGRRLDPAEELLIGFDTYDADRGTTLLSPVIGERAPTGLEFLLTVSGSADIGTHESSPPDDVWRNDRGERAEVRAVAGYAVGNLGFASPSVAAPGNASSSDDETRPHEPGFEEIRILVNRALPAAPGRPGRDAQYWPAGRLRAGPPEEPGTQWYADDEGYHFRIPYTLLNVADPTRFSVIHHPHPVRSYPEGQDVLLTTPSDGILLSIRQIRQNEILGSFDGAERVRPEPWSIPRYGARPKAGYVILRDYLGEAHDEAR